jgi:Protein of unknown function (DUF1579)
MKGAEMKHLFVRLLLLSCLCLGACVCAAQTSNNQQTPAPTRSCDLPEGKQFDFWVGEWELKWPAGQGGAAAGQVGTGTNVIKKILGNSIVEENFGSSMTQMKGMSFSAYDQRTGEWKQTWVDNGGSYLLFTGKFKDGVMELRSPPRVTPKGKIINRMVYKNITGNSLDWDYQYSIDEGKTWVDAWNIHYTRKK